MAEQDSQYELSFKGLFVPFTTLKAIHWIVLIGIIIYGNMLFNGFVGDDNGQILNNISVHSIGNIWHFFTNSTFNNVPGNDLINGIYYKPLLSTTFSVLYTFFGGWAPIFHFFQLTLHITNSVLLFVIFKRLLKKEIAFGISLLFLVLPINNEAVVFVSALQEPLLLFFGLIAFSISLRKQQSLVTISITTILLLCSLLSKETGVLFLLILPLYQIFFYRSWKIQTLEAATALFIYVVLRFFVAHIFFNTDQTLVTIPFAHISLLQKLENIPSIIFFYIKTFFFPKDLMIGQRWVISHINENNFYLPLLIDAVFFAGIIAFGVTIYKRYTSYFKLFLFFSCWFVLGLFMHLQLLPLDATVATRWFYFPGIGLLGLLGTAGNVINFKSKRTKIIYFTLLVSLIVTFGIRDIVRNANWKNEITLYTHEIQYARDDYALQLNFATALSNAGNQKEALLHILYSVKLHPTVNNLDLLALIYVKSHQIPKAEKTLMEALKYDSNSYNTYILLTEVMLSFDKPQATVPILKQFLSKYPNEAATWLYLAIEEYNAGDKEGAISSVQKSLQLQPSVQGQNLYSDIVGNKPVRMNFSF